MGKKLRKKSVPGPGTTEFRKIEGFGIITLRAQNARKLDLAKNTKNVGPRSGDHRISQNKGFSYKHSFPLPPER